MLLSYSSCLCPFLYYKICFIFIDTIYSCVTFLCLLCLYLIYNLFPKCFQKLYLIVFKSLLVLKYRTGKKNLCFFVSVSVSMYTGIFDDANLLYVLYLYSLNFVYLLFISGPCFISCLL